uniref:Spindle pole body component n=1 Tax=Peronospora matthiolae TaxID=2874970 RepID=A0AAV1UA43_9STRA
MAAWTRELRPLAEQLCVHVNSSRQGNAVDRLPLSQEELCVRVNRVVGLLGSHLFVDCVPQDVQTQTRALATKFRVHSLDDRAEKLLQLAQGCDYQVLKLLLELATSPTSATDEEAAVDQDSQMEWNAVLQQEKLRQEKQKRMEAQIREELYQIAAHGEWYQAWDNSEDESNGEMNSDDDWAAMDSERVARTAQCSAKSLREDVEDQDCMKQNDAASTSLDPAGSDAAVDEREQLEDLEEDAALLDEILCRYHPEVTLQDVRMVAGDPTCELDTRAPVSFTLERPWLLCEAVVKSASSRRPAASEFLPRRLIHEKSAVNMVFEALHGVDSLLFEFCPITPVPTIFSIDFRAKAVKRSQRSLDTAVGHLSPLAFHNILDSFAQAASELQLLRDFLEFMRQAEGSKEHHRCLTLEGLANSLSEVMRSISRSIHTVEHQINDAAGEAANDPRPWCGINTRQPTLLGIFGGLKEIFGTVSWLRRILAESFEALSGRHWYEVKRAEQAKRVLDSLYHAMEVEHVVGVIGAASPSATCRLVRSDVLLHLFCGALSPYLAVINQMIFEVGCCKTVPLNDELFFATSACTQIGEAPKRGQTHSFQEELLALAPFKLILNLVPAFLESKTDVMNEALASRQMLNSFLHQSSTKVALTKAKQTRLPLHDLRTTELRTMGSKRDGDILSLTAASAANNESAPTFSEQTSLESVPFKSLMELCVTRHLETKCRELNSEVTGIFRSELNYMEHVEALRMFVLMERQDFFSIFSKQMVSHMQRNPIAWADSDVISSFHQSAVQEVCEDKSLSSLQRQIGSRLCVRVDFSLLDCSTSGASIDIVTMNCVRFAFSVQQPLRVLFSTSIMHKYSRLGVLLVQVKAVESALVKFKSALRHRRCYSLIENDMQQLLLRIADMLHYTQSLLNYLTSQISCSKWLEYRHILRSSSSLAEMNATHEEYLDYLLNRFFLLEKHASVTRYILTTFNHILRFVGQAEEFVCAVDRNVHAYFPSGQNEDLDKLEPTIRIREASRVRILDHPDFRILYSGMMRCSSEFKRQSHILVVMLTAMQKHGASPHVNEIVTQLNYNYFYHQQEQTRKQSRH